MKKTSEYRRHAEECRGLALKAATEEHRAQLLKMADTWASLAEERERMVERHPELFPASESDSDSS